MFELNVDVGAPVVLVQFEDRPLTLPQLATTLLAVDRLWATSFLLGAYYDGVDAERYSDVYVEQMPAFVPLRWASSYDTADPPIDLRIPRPSGLRVSYASPLIIEVSDVALTIGGLAAAPFVWKVFTWCVRHPKEIGGFVPSLVGEWHRGWSKADKARRDRALLSWYPGAGHASDAGTTYFALGQLTNVAERAGYTVAETGVIEVQTEGFGDDWAPPA